MLNYLANRLAMLIATVLVASMAIYGSLYLAPGDPLSTLTGGRQLPDSTKAELRSRYHLNEGLPLRYWHWLTSALHGNFGYSVANRENVSIVLRERIATSAELIVYATLIIILLGVLAGIVAAIRPGLIDSSIVLTVTVLAALPSFVASLLLISVFAVNLRWFPAFGTGSGFTGQLRHLTLPAIALATSSAALVARITRTAVRTERAREHVQTAVSRGLSPRSVLSRHILRNAAIPITTVTGLTIASLIALVSIVEQAFNLNGIGATLVKAAADKDFALVQAIALIMVAAFVVINAIVDALYVLLDPRLALAKPAA
ncbi:MAG: ABC transporter permease [Actinomycetota bacterium]|nr:ABC transporter permease [Actinomycetota bacterium]